MNTITVPFQDAFTRIARRALKAFISGALAAFTIQLAQAPQISSLLDFKQWGITLFIACMVGGIMALEKSFSIWMES